MRVLARCPADTATLEDLRRLGDRVDSIRSADGSLRRAASGINSYVYLCSLLGRPFLPPQEGAIILRHSCFRPGRTFRNYIGHLKKDCLLAERPIERYATAVGEIARGGTIQRALFQFP